VAGRALSRNVFVTVRGLRLLWQVESSLQSCFCYSKRLLWQQVESSIQSCFCYSKRLLWQVESSVHRCFCDRKFSNCESSNVLFINIMCEVAPEVCSPVYPPTWVSNKPVVNLYPYFLQKLFISVIFHFSSVCPSIFVTQWVTRHVTLLITFDL